MKVFFASAIASLLLVASAARAEDRPGCLKVDTIKAAHRTVAPGGELKVKVKLKASHCFIATDFAAGAATLFIEPVPTFETGIGPITYSGPVPAFESTIGPITYSGVEGKQPHRDDTRAHAIEAVVDFKADRFLPGGEYTLRAFLNYKAVDAQGKAADESLFFTIPVLVRWSQHPSLADEHPKIHRTLDVLLGIVELPVLIVMGLLGLLPEC